MPPGLCTNDKRSASYFRSFITPQEYNHQLDNRTIRSLHARDKNSRVRLSGEICSFPVSLADRALSPHLTVSS